jgi:hypothetical protein
VQKAKKWQNRKAFKAAGISTLSIANIEIIYKKAPLQRQECAGFIDKMKPKTLKLETSKYFNVVSNSETTYFAIASFLRPLLTECRISK